MARKATSSANQVVSVPGMDAFIRDLKRADSDLTHKMQVANNDAAAVVLREAVRKRDSQPGAARKTTVKTGNQANRSSVVIGSAREPWALGAEFGALRYRQFQPWRGNQWTNGTGDRWGGADPDVGYFLHPAIRATRSEFLAEYTKQIDKIIDDLATG
jgi:hypothetical protein